MKRTLILLILFLFFIAVGFTCGGRIEELHLDVGISFNPLDIAVSAKFSKIFANNITYCALLVLGCGFITAPLLALQGFLLGLPLGIWILNSKPFEEYLLLTLPHAIIEIPALLLAASNGFTLLTVICSYVKCESPQIKCQHWKGFIERLFLILFLIIIAAAIESFLTLKIYKGVWGT